MTIVTTPPQLETTDEALLTLINLLRHQHAMDQHMLMTRSPEERTLERLDEIRAKNTELEQRNRELHNAVDGTRMVYEAREQTSAQKDVEIKRLKEEISALHLDRNTSIGEYEAQIKRLKEEVARLLNYATELLHDPRLRGPETPHKMAEATDTASSVAKMDENERMARDNQTTRMPPKSVTINF